MVVRVLPFMMLQWGEKCAEQVLCHVGQFTLRLAFGPQWIGCGSLARTRLCTLDGICGSPELSRLSTTTRDFFISVMSSAFPYMSFKERVRRWGTGSGPMGRPPRF